MSDSVRPHRRQPTRLPGPWDSPGKNTGVGCHFLLQCMKVKSESEVTQSCPILSYPMDCSLPGSSIHGIFQARLLEWGAIAFSIWMGQLHSKVLALWRHSIPMLIPCLFLVQGPHLVTKIHFTWLLMISFCQFSCIYMSMLYSIHISRSFSGNYIYLNEVLDSYNRKPQIAMT